METKIPAFPPNKSVEAPEKELIQALEGLTKAIDLRKLKVRRDFSLLVAHAYALKVLYKINEKKENVKG
jgi:hypothetical protein